jgi:hypothetical protein
MGFSLQCIYCMLCTCADWPGGFHNHSVHHHFHKCHNPHRHRRRRRYRRCHVGDDDDYDDDDDDVPAVVLSRGRPLQLRLLKPPPVVAVAFVRRTAFGDGDVRRCRRTAKWRRSEGCLRPRPLLLLPYPQRSLRGCPY